MNDYFCDSCKVTVSSDLKYCPLCGKCLNNKINKAPENESSFPIIDQSYIYTAKWLKIIKEFCILISLVLIAINLIFWAYPLWFPYPVAAIFVIYMCIFHPFGDDKNHIHCLPLMGFVIASFIAGIDIYAHFMSNTSFGWGIFVVCPLVLVAFGLTSFILAIVLKKFDIALLKNMIWYGIIETIFLVFKLIFFKNQVTWPWFMALCISIFSVTILYIFKSKRVQTEMNRNFHI